MTQQTERTELTDKQRGYARYLLKLNIGRRNDALAKIRPPLRENMRGYMRDAWAQQVAGFEPDVKRLYLERLRNENRLEYNALLPLVAAFEAVGVGV